METGLMGSARLLVFDMEVEGRMPFVTNDLVQWFEEWLGATGKAWKHQIGDEKNPKETLKNQQRKTLRKKPKSKGLKPKKREGEQPTSLVDR